MKILWMQGASIGALLEYCQNLEIWLAPYLQMSTLAGW